MRMTNVILNEVKNLRCHSREGGNPVFGGRVSALVRVIRADAGIQTNPENEE